MAYYRPCPVCGAALDPGEICTDCQDATRTQREIEKAASVLEHRDGQVEIGLPTNISNSMIAKTKLKIKEACRTNE